MRETWLVPTVERGEPEGIHKTTTIDGWELRRQFLKLENDEESAVQFLTDVGIWKAIPEADVGSWRKAIPETENKASALRMDGVFGSRYFCGRALPMFVSDLWKEQKHWKELLRHPNKLKEIFGPPPPATARPIDMLRFAVDSRFFNELPLRMEWRKGRPMAVIEAITLDELLIATTQADLLRNPKFKVCRRPDCRTSFPVLTRHRRKYCSWDCAHIESVRRTRRNQKREKRHA